MERGHRCGLPARNERAGHYFQAELPGSSILSLFTSTILEPLSALELAQPDTAEPETFSLCSCRFGQKYVCIEVSIYAPEK